MEKTNDMKILRNILLLLLLPVLLIACGGGAKKNKGSVGDLKTELEKLRKQKTELEAEMRTIEDRIAQADPTAAQQAKKTVGTDTLRLQHFRHYIELQGKIDAEGMAYVAPKGPGGLIKAIYVKPGQRVNRGQLILKLDDAVSRQAVIAAQQQTGQLQARLAQAQTIYERYKNLWSQNIGAEINVINAKADVDALSAQLNAARAQVAMAQEQANMTNVVAEIGGVVDEVNVKVGEFFSPQSAAMPRMGIRIVNTTNMKIVTSVPDNYVARVRQGDSVEVVVPETGKPAFLSKLYRVGVSIDPTTRSFTVEARLPSDPLLKPNQTATMKILDYEVKQAVTVPVNLVQRDEKSKYVYVVEMTGGKAVARRKQVETGEAYNGLMEIRNGLSGGDVLITEGYQSVYDGQAVILYR